MNDGFRLSVWTSTNGLCLFMCILIVGYNASNIHWNDYSLPMSWLMYPYYLHLVRKKERDREKQREKK